MGERKKAIIWARVSTAGQAKEELPIESQLDRCRKKAEELGAEVVKVFVEDGVSGRKERRDTFQAAVDYCGVFEIDYFILWNTARFARHRALAAWTKHNLRRGGTELVYVSQNIDTSTDEGWLLEGFFELIDEQMSRTISKDTLRSMMKNASAGNFNGGTAPYGYAVVPDGKRKRLAVREDEAAIVRKIFAMCIEGSGATSITLWLNQHGFTRRGRTWTRDAVNHVLKNWVYAGYVTFRPKFAKARSDLAEGVIRTKSHPAIIEEAVLMTSLDMIRERTPERELGSPNSTFIFTGILRCGACGSAMQIRTGTGGNGTVYSYYQCGGNLRGKGCSPRAIPAHSFDRVIGEQVLEVLLSDQAFVDMAADLDALAGSWARDRAAQRDILVGRLREAERRRKNLFDLLEEHGPRTPNLGDLTVRLRELNDQVKQVEESLAALEDAAPPAQPTREAVVAATELVREVFSTAEPAEMRGFLASFIDKIVLKGGELEYHYHPTRLFEAGFVRSGPKWHPGHESNVRPAP